MSHERRDRYFSLFPSETPQYALHQIREQLNSNKKVQSSSEKS